MKDFGDTYEFKKSTIRQGRFQLSTSGKLKTIDLGSGSVYQHVVPPRPDRSSSKFRSMLKNRSTFMPSGPMCTRRT